MIRVDRFSLFKLKLLNQTDLHIFLDLSRWVQTSGRKGHIVDQKLKLLKFLAQGSKLLQILGDQFFWFVHVKVHSVKFVLNRELFETVKIRKVLNQVLVIFVKSKEEKFAIVGLA